MEEDIDMDTNMMATDFTPRLRYRHRYSITGLFEKIPEPIKYSLRPPLTCNACVKFVMTRLPVLDWLWTYQKSYIFGDVVAGLTVAIITIYQALAFALLANVPPIYGLYASFLPTVIYALLGSSRHLSVGTFAVVQLLMGNTVEHVLTRHESLQNCSISATANINNTEVMFQGEETTCEAVKVDIVITLAFLSGSIMIVMGVLQLGFITIFLSEPLLSGYTTGAAMHVFSRQLQHITGLGEIIRVPQGHLMIPKMWIATLQNIPSWNWAAFITSFIFITFLFTVKGFKGLLKRPGFLRCFTFQWRGKAVTVCPSRIPIPSEIIAVVVAIVASYFASVQEKYHIAVIERVPAGLPRASRPNTMLMSALIKDAFIISIVIFSISVSVGTAAGHSFGYKIHSNQEFLALGLANFLGSFFSSFSSSGSVFRTNIQASKGGHTQLTGLISAAVVLVVLLKLGSLLQPLPTAILGAIVWVAVCSKFKQFLTDFYNYFKISIPDWLVLVVTFLISILLDIDLGLAVGLGLSMLIVMLRIICPYTSVLGHINGNFTTMDNFEKVDIAPGILIFRFPAPICFLNSQVFQLQLRVACNLKKASTNKNDGDTESCLQALLSKFGWMQRMDIEDLTLGQNGGSHRYTEDSIHTVIIDCAPIAFIDSAGIEALRVVMVEFEKFDIQVLFAGLTYNNRKIMMRSKFFRTYDKEWLFPSIHAAVRHTQLDLNSEESGKVSPVSIRSTEAML